MNFALVGRLFFPRRDCTPNLFLFFSFPSHPWSRALIFNLFLASSEDELRSPLFSPPSAFFFLARVLAFLSISSPPRLQPIPSGIFLNPPFVSWLLPSGEILLPLPSTPFRVYSDVVPVSSRLSIWSSAFSVQRFRSFPFSRSQSGAHLLFLQS